MELFKILGTIAVSNSDANDAIDETADKAEKSEGRIGKAFGLIGKSAVACGKAMAAGLAAGVTAISGLTKTALDSYADYEQLVGGIETLYGTGGKSIEEYAASVGKSVDEVADEYERMTYAQERAMEYAKEAYKTAGLSANDYMETATSFAAALVSSLGGDTLDAIDMADMAISDMSDNANKMGSDMSAIQNAYNGFAKQNYTMLDNLKLGYGGTKEEMQRLIKDANKIRKEQGITTKLTIDSYADIVEAIHLVQVEMGIYGTTAKEASGTISGSIGMMKGAWKNFLTTMTGSSTEEFNKNVQSLVESVVTVAKNIAPRLLEIVPNIVSGLTMVAESIIPYIAPIMEELLPAIMQGAANLVMYLVQNMPALLASLGAALWEALKTILSEIGNMLPDTVTQKLKALKSWFEKIGNYASKSFKPIIEDLKKAFIAIKDAVGNLIDRLKEYFKESEAASNITYIVQASIDALVEAYYTIKDALIVVVEWCKEHKELLENLAIVIGSVAVAIGAVHAAIAIYNTVTTIATAVTTAFSTIMAVLTSPITLVVAAIAALVAAIVLCIKYWDEIKAAAVGAWEKIKSTFEGIGAWFGRVFGGAYEAVTGAFSKVGEFFTNIFNKIKGIFQSIGESIGSAVSTAFKTAVNWVLEKAIGIINGFISAINAVIGVLNEIPGVSITKIKKLDVPEMEEGGVLKKGQVGLLEGNGTEAVVPLEKNTEWIKRTADQMNSALLNTNTGNNDSLLADKIDELISLVKKLKIYLDSGVLVGELAPEMNRQLGRIYSRNERGTY